MAGTYLSLADTARLIRKALSRSFPQTKFYVRSRSYSGGSSIDVSYDGRVGYRPLAACHCRQGPDVDPARAPNQCRRCNYMGRLEPIYKRGAPTREQVAGVTRPFESRGFDGMIDLTYYIDAYVDAAGMPVGTRSAGTAGSRGSVPAWDDAPRSYARIVSFGVGHVFVNDELPYDIRSKAV